MEILERTVGETKGHEAQPPSEVKEYQLIDRNGFSITVWNYGATLVAVCPFADDPSNLVLRLRDLQDYESYEQNPCLIGATIGRYARGIANGRFYLDKKVHELTRNHGEHHFHGGSLGFNRFVWHAETIKSPTQVAISLKHISPDGDQGYPGTVSVETRFILSSNSTLEISHRAITDAPTIVGITNHAYWNLAGDGDINHHVLGINASTVIVNDDELLPLGAPIPVSELGLDFSRPRTIATQQIDHCFPLVNSDWAYTLEDPVSGRRMSVQSNQPVLAVYTADSYTRARSGLCLQTTDWPNSPNRKDFPPSRLDPTSTYNHRSIYTFSIVGHFPGKRST